MSYFDTTVFNRIALQQKETNDLLRELIKTLQEQKSKCRYPTQNFEPPTQAQQPDGDVVAYLDVGANGCLDLGSELSEDALHQLPKGRHALVVAGTYGIDGYVATPPPSTKAQEADSVPAVDREQERIAFKDAHRHLDLDEVPDAWGRPMFKHSHVEASWLGWIARASHGQAPAGDWLWVKLMDFCKKRRFAPANFNDLFEIVDAARAARAPADSVLEDAACWHWLAEYLVGTRTDLDDEIVASETVNDLRNLVEAAIKQGATK